MTKLLRRDFFVASASLSAGIYASGVTASPRSSALDLLNIACVGTANRAADDIVGVLSQKIVAVCDIDRKYLNLSRKFIKERQGHTPAGFDDYREMIDRLGARFDAVVVATADHHHAPATIRALRAGKHVYCEKPLTHTVHEARLVAEAAETAGVATQLGTQMHASNNYRRVVEVIRSGVIGDVEEVHVWVSKTWGGGDRPKLSDPIPDHLNWDLWLGPAPKRDYKAGLYHPRNWRRWWDFGSGTLGDMACHYMDLPFWALDLTHPSFCRSAGPVLHPDTCPLGLTVYYKFPANNDRPPVDLTWYDGSMIPREIHGQRVKANGVMFVGSNGMMFADYGSYKLFPQDKFADFDAPAKTLPDSVGHYREWILACRDGSPTTCNFAYSGALTEAVQLGNVAFRTGEILEWDAENLKATNTEKAAKFVTKEYRTGWEVV